MQGIAAGAVSVLVPAWNAAATLRPSLLSVLDQALPPLEVVVVDDGSTDATPAILAEMAAAEPRIRVLRQANGGIVAALNAGLPLCRGALIARHDADDLADPGRFARQAAWLAGHPDCVAVAGAYRLIDHAGRPVVRDGVAQCQAPADPAAADPAWLPAIEPYLCHPFAMFRAAALRAVGGYRHVFNAEDSDLYWRLGERGRLVNLPELMGSYRLHDTSISARSIGSGRIMAVFSQLAALSARRRAAGRPDLAFPAQRRPAVLAAAGIEALLTLAGDGLEPWELDHLRAASAAKLLELAGYRPYELELADCRFIRSVLKAPPPHAPANGRLLRRQLAATAARLLRTGRPREALALLPPGLAPEALARAVTGRFFWTRLVPVPPDRPAGSRSRDLPPQEVPDASDSCGSEGHLDLRADGGGGEAGGRLLHP